MERSTLQIFWKIPPCTRMYHCYTYQTGQCFLHPPDNEWFTLKSLAHCLFPWITPDTTRVIWVLWETGNTEKELDEQKFIRDNICGGNWWRSWKKLRDLTYPDAGLMLVGVGRKKEELDARVVDSMAILRKFARLLVNPQAKVAHQRSPPSSSLAPVLASLIPYSTCSWLMG